MLVVVVICKYVMWCVVFFLMILRPQCSTRAATLVPYTTLFRSRGGTWPRRVAQHARCALAPGHLRHHGVEGEVPLGIIAARHVLGLFHGVVRSEEHTSELQSLMRISYAVFCLKQKKLRTHSNTCHLITHMTLYTHIMSSSD